MSIDRRRFLSASAAAMAAPYVRTSHAAGSLAVGFWDHWVPGANDVMTKLCNEWAAKEKVDLRIDFINSQGNKDRLTIAAEAQARSGHDILAFPVWDAIGHAKDLEPVDDVMKEVLANNGKTNPVVEYLAHQGGRWIAVPATPGSLLQAPC